MMISENTERAEPILFVDDEPNVLHSIKRNLRNRYAIDTAQSSQEALEALASKGPYAIIVSDMQMPVMNGTELLSRAKQCAPSTVRMMLTGNADQKTAIDAINKGDILRFLNKPTTADEIAAALEAGLAQYRLITAEQRLLQDTVRGSIQALAEILALSRPDLFGRSMRLKTRMRQLVQALELDDLWQWESAAMMSQVGCVSLSADLIKRKAMGCQLDASDTSSFAGHATAGGDLLATIPRMESIADAIRYQEKYFDGSGTPCDPVKGNAIPLGARLLRPLLDLDTLETAGVAINDAMIQLKQHHGRYDPTVLVALADVVRAVPTWEAREVSLHALSDEMKLASDLHTSDGQLLVAAGQSTTASVRRHMSSFHENGLISARVVVRVPLQS